MTEPRDPILVEHEKLHGYFPKNAQIWQKLCFMLNDNATVLANDSQRLAISMIFLKLSRIMSGQVKERDHWNDIAGYAKLGSEACDDNK